MGIRERRNRLNFHLSWEPLQTIDKRKLIGLLILIGVIAVGAIIAVNIIWRGNINSSDLANKETISVGIRTDVEGFATANDAGGTEGFDVDVATEILNRVFETEKPLQFVVLNSEDAGAKIKYGSIDLGFGFLVEGTDRVSGFLMTDPYYSDKVYCIAAESSTAQSMKDMDGKNVGVLNSIITQSMTTGILEKEGIQAEVKRYFDYESAKEDLNSGKIDCFMLPEALMKQYMGEYKIIGEAVAEVGYSVILPSGQKVMQRAINDAIGSMRNDGTMEALAVKWGIPYNI